MRKQLTNLFMALLTLMLLGSCAGSSQKELTGAPVPLADPYIFYHQGLYYAYGTHSANGIEVYTSKDMLQWTYQGLALDKNDSWGDKWFWAPEVYHQNGRFYMFYSAEEHVCVAVADSPLGPFRQPVKEPLLADNGIDSSLFIDDDGTPYMFYVRFEHANVVWVAEMNLDLLSIKKETLHRCFKASQDWEMGCEGYRGSVNEGPFVVKHNGLYYMTYSANDYRCKTYGIGCATATDIMGEWTKYADNPLLQCPDTLVGVGHHSLFTDRKGDLRIVFHSHLNDTTVHPRIMNIGTAGFKKASPHDKFVISQEYFTPRLVQDAGSPKP